MAAQIESVPPGDPHWIGRQETFNSTMGNDFWLTFMNNDMFALSDTNNIDKRFELQIMVSVIEETTINVEIGGVVRNVKTVPANSTDTFDVSAYWSQIYLYHSETPYPAGGVHIYATDKDKKFSCFNYSRVKETGGSSRDALLIIPTKYLGKEYIVQTYPQSQDATEFAIVATEDGTQVTITPSFATFNNKHQQGVAYTITMAKGEAYLVASRNHQNRDFIVDLSGTTICADKPVAVFNGNQATSIPFDEGTSLDFLGEQMQPLSHWGTDFYIGKFQNTVLNEAIVTAQLDGTTVRIAPYTYFDENLFQSVELPFKDTVLDAQESFLFDIGDDYMENCVVTSSKPVECYSYMTSAAENKLNRVFYGDPANAMVPSWDHRVKKMNFFTKALDPQVATSPQRFFAYLVVPTADANSGKIKVDNAIVSASNFVSFDAKSAMSYASVEVHGHGYHTVESTGEGFVGIVYGVTASQGWEYTLGYTPDPYRDSLFLTAPEGVMSEPSYHITRADQGYYQRQLDEWETGFERLDTAYVCEGTEVHWLAQYPLQKHVSPVEWKLYDITDKPEGEVYHQYTNAILEDSYEDETPVGQKQNYTWQYLFDLPDELEMEPEEREPFRVYELLVISHKNATLCPDNEPDLDTLRMAIRVNRVYHDTIYKIMCMGDTLPFFFDSVPHQEKIDGEILDVPSLPSSKLAAEPDSTLFIGDNTEGDATDDFTWKARSGENIFTRQYKSQFGCDSTYTLYLFVCDTFRILDTIHLCDNETIRFNDTLYYGPKYVPPVGLGLPLGAVLVEQDTVVEQHYKTKWCDCVTDDRYPKPFLGCDSIYELHFFVHETTRDTLRDTVCAACGDTYQYKWPIQYGTDTLVINQRSPEMKWHPELDAWFGTFVDTLRTTTCPDCNEGKGCDSIQILELTVPKSYCFDSTATFCRWVYDWETRQKVDSTFRWHGHREGDVPKYVDLSESGDYYDSCQTVRYGCDSVYHLKLTYLEPYLKVDTYAMPNNQTYVWRGHNGNEVYGPYPEYLNDTIIYIYDRAADKTKDDCDSIIRLDLHIVPSYINDTTIDLCVNKMTTWRDHRLVGSLYDQPMTGDTLYDINELEGYVLIDSLKTNTEPAADSIFRLTLYVHPIYVQYDTVHLCDNKIHTWGKYITYVGPKYMGNVAGNKQVLGAESEYDYTYNLKTDDECDSIWNVHVEVHPTYEETKQDTICLGSNYIWEGHPNITIATDKAGWATYTDSLHTSDCPDCALGYCDSIWHLQLYIPQLYTAKEPYAKICDKESFEWKGRIFAGAKSPAAQSPAANTIVLTQPGEYTYYDTVRYTYPGHECDSLITTLTFRMDTSTVTRKYATVCYPTEKTYNFDGQTVSLTGAGVMTVQKDLQTATECDSTVILTLQVYQSYDIEEAGARIHVCQQDGGTYEWSGHMMELYDAATNTAVTTIPTSKAGTYHYQSRLKTSHGCDSIYNLYLTVDPVYYIEENATICEGESYTWQAGGDTVVMGREEVRTTNTQLGEKMYVSEDYTKHYNSKIGAHCDSTRVLHLTVKPKVYERVDMHLSTTDAPVVWNGTTIATDHQYADTVPYHTTSERFGCDSLVELYVVVDSSYYWKEDSIVCVNNPFTWTGHPKTRSTLYGQDGKPTAISTANVGLTIYRDSMLTINGTDSIHDLYLHVMPVYSHDTVMCICDNDYVLWQDSVFAGDKAVLPSGVVATRILSAGTTTHFVNHPSQYGCDSTFTLELTIKPTHLTVASKDTTYIHICEDESYYFESKGEMHRWDTPDGKVSRFVLTDIVPTAIHCDGVQGCDSAIAHVVYVHPEYNYEESKTDCQHPTDVYDWEGHTSPYYYWVEGRKRVNTISLAHAGDYTYVDSLLTETCADCERNGCDSVWTLHLHIDSVYHVTESKQTCELALPYVWEGHYDKTTHAPLTYTAAGSYVDTISSVVTGCDSIVTLQLEVIDNTPRTIPVEVCNNAEPFVAGALNWAVTPADSLPGTYRIVQMVPIGAGCDYEETIVLTIHPISVDNIYSDTICQADGGYYPWTNHTTRPLWDKQMHRRIAADKISIDKPGYYEYVDSTTTVHGCDSVWTLHLRVGERYRWDSVACICDNDAYRWQDTLYVGSHYTGELPANGKYRVVNQSTYFDYNYHSRYGCDSIYTLDLTIKSTHLTLTEHDTTNVHICEDDSYYFASKDKTYKWETPDHVISRFVLTDTIPTTVKCDGVQGCDSAIVHVVYVHPVYEYTTDTAVCQTEYFEWSSQIKEEPNHMIWDVRQQKQIRADQIPADIAAGTYTYIDSLKTKTCADCRNTVGCDSVWVLHLRVDSAYHKYTAHQMSDEDYYLWDKNNTIYAGAKVDKGSLPQGVTTKDIPLGADYYYDTIPGNSIHDCDSTHYLTIRIGQVYRIHTYDTVCVNDPYTWSEVEPTTKVRQTIKTIPESTLTPGAWYTEEHREQTVMGFDSIYYLHLYVAPIYDTTTYAYTCEHNNYIWEGHEGRALLNYETGVIGLLDVSASAARHTYHYVDTLQSKFGCDSVCRLMLYVAPVYDLHDTVEVCQYDNEGAYIWEQHTGHKWWSENAQDSVDVLSTNVAGTYVYVDPRHGTKTYDCDSIWTLHLMVHPTRIVVEDTTYTHICDNEEYSFETVSHSEVVKGIDYKNDAHSIVRIQLEGKDTTVYGCDSAVCHVVYVHPTYVYEKVDSICQGSEYTWLEHTDRLLWDERQGKRIDANAIPTNLKAGVTYTYVDSLHTETCTDCRNTVGCDSVWVLHLRVDSVYHTTDTLTMSDEETRKWEHTIYVGAVVNTDTLSASWYEPEVSEGMARPAVVVVPKGSVVNDFDTLYHSIHGCDSLRSLHLLVGPTFRDTIVRYTCDNEPYHWYHEGDNREVKPEVEKLTPGLYYDSLKTVGFGFDSIYVLDLRNNLTYLIPEVDTVCQGSTYLWPNHTESTQFYLQNEHRWIAYDQIPTDVATTLSLIDSLKTKEYAWGEGQPVPTGCDSVHVLTLLIPPIHHIYDSITICENDSAEWEGHLFTGREYAAYGNTYDADRFRGELHTGISAGVYAEIDTAHYYTEGYGCDSVHHLKLTVLPVYRADSTIRVCQSDAGQYYALLNNGAGGTLPSQYLYQSLTRNDTVHTLVGCDSIVTLHYYVDSVYRYTQKEYTCQVYGGTYDWVNPQGKVEQTVSIDKGDTTLFLGKQYTTIHGCDSTYGIELYIAPIHHIYEEHSICESDSLEWQGHLFTGREYAAYGKTYDASRFRGTPHTALAAGTYMEIDTAHYYTVGYGCDSVYHLKLHVQPVYRTTIERRTCQHEDGYYYEHLNNGVGGTLPSKYLHQSLTRNDTILTTSGCDSIITLNYYVDSVYDYRQTIAVCQDTVSKWEWVDDEGHSHGMIDISVAKDTSLVEAHKTIHGCDSIYGLTLHIAPIYRFDSVYNICENERLVWQHRQYTGDSVVFDANDTTILAPGLYYDTAHYYTVEGCDSTYYMQLHVHPIFDTMTIAKGCYNEDFVWYQQDHNGAYADTLWHKQEQRIIYTTAPEASEPYPARDTLMRYHERMLETVHGCDSLSRIWITIHPSYFFFTDTTICANERLLYRGKYFNLKDTIYTEALKTQDGCDSIYQLRLHIKPTYVFHRTISGCDVDTFYHRSLNGEEIVWKPGYYVPEDPEYDYIDMRYETSEGCDSIYRYHLTIYPTMYDTLSSVVICSNETYTNPEGTHTWNGYEHEYDTDTFVLPYDTTIVDAYQSIHGCDSVYTLLATIYPAYRHVDSDTICDDGETAWREHSWQGSMIGNVLGDGLAAGDYVFYDSLRTVDDMCDSIYEFRLRVTPTYLFETYDTICADEPYYWRAHVYNTADSLLPDDQKDYFYYDSLTTVGYGCDSVFHLYLHVLDTTYEVFYDTICSQDTLTRYGKYYTQPGDYKDTITNDWGCHQFVYLHLEVIEPTVPTAWVDSLCMDDRAFNLYFTYTGRDPVACSVFYDEAGYSQGFDSIVGMPLNVTGDTLEIQIPMPDRTLEDKTQYPRPDRYGIHLVLDNGICEHKDPWCATDTAVTLNYPSWLTEQRFRDLIGILSYDYNGGYEFTHYQWYRDNQPVPGEVLPYLYVPTELDRDTVEYFVMLTRKDDGKTHQTCPITIYYDGGLDKPAPQDGYLSVTPTYISRSNPVMYIHCTGPGRYWVYGASGQLTGVQGDYQPQSATVNAMAVDLSSLTEGVYVVHLEGTDGTRAVKILITPGDRHYDPYYHADKPYYKAPAIKKRYSE